MVVSIRQGESMVNFIIEKPPSFSVTRDAKHCSEEEEWGIILAHEKYFSPIHRPLSTLSVPLRLYKWKPQLSYLHITVISHSVAETCPSIRSLSRWSGSKNNKWIFYFWSKETHLRSMPSLWVFHRTGFLKNFIWGSKISWVWFTLPRECRIYWEDRQINRQLQHSLEP